MNIDLKNAFPAMTDKENDALMEAARSVLDESKAEQHMKRKIPMGVLIFAIMALLTATVAVAEELGILEIGGGIFLPSAQNLVQKDFGVSETEYVTFNITQAVYDGRTATIMVEVTPKDDKTLIIPDVYYPEEDQIGYLLPIDHENHEDPNSPTIAEYAMQNGYERILWVSTDCAPTANVQSIGSTDKWRDNKITMLFDFEASGPQTIVANCYYRVCPAGDPEQVEKVDVSITLTAKAPLWSAVCTTPTVTPDIYLKKVDVVGTELATYVELTLTKGGIRYQPNLMDALGGYAPIGFVNSGRGHTNDDGSVTWLLTMAPAETAPNAIYLMFWDGETGEEAARVGIPLNPQ